MRFGPSLFRCRTCHNPHGWQLKCRPRVWQCKACRRQQSVLAGTTLQWAKLRIEAFMVRLHLADTHELVSSTALAGRLRIARSSAWHLNHRVMAIAAATRPPGASQGLFEVEFKCRHPQRSPPLHPETPGAFGNVRAQFMLGHPPHRAAVSIEALGPRLVLHRAALSDEERREVRRRPPVDLFYHLDVLRWLPRTLAEVFSAVSLRWLPRYVSHALYVWNQRHRRADPRAERLPLIQRALDSPSMTLRQLRPYDATPSQEPGPWGSAPLSSGRDPDGERNQGREGGGRDARQ